MAASHRIAEMIDFRAIRPSPKSAHGVAWRSPARGVPVGLYTHLSADSAGRTACRPARPQPGQSPRVGRLCISCAEGGGAALARTRALCGCLEAKRERFRSMVTPRFDATAARACCLASLG